MLVDKFGRCLAAQRRGPKGQLLLAVRSDRMERDFVKKLRIDKLSGLASEESWLGNLEATPENVISIYRIISYIDRQAGGLGPRLGSPALERASGNCMILPVSKMGSEFRAVRGASRPARS